MNRFLFTVQASLLVGSSLLAQGITTPYQPPNPQSNVIPAPYGWWAPNSFSGPNFGSYYPYGYGYGYGYGGLGYGYGGFGYGAYGYSSVPLINNTGMFSQTQGYIPSATPALVGAGTASRLPVINPNLVAEFDITFPTAVQLWVNGNKQDGSKARWTLTSQPLQRGEKHTFAVKAKWSADGADYVWNRTVTLVSGERSKANVLSGFKE